LVAPHGLGGADDRKSIGILLLWPVSWQKRINPEDMSAVSEAQAGTRLLEEGAGLKSASRQWRKAFKERLAARGKEEA
jgi:hypothetical protein